MIISKYVLLSGNLAAEMIEDTLKGHFSLFHIYDNLMGAAPKRKNFLPLETLGWGCIVWRVVIAN